MTRILALDLGGTKILPCTADAVGENVFNFRIGPEVKIADAQNSVDLFRMLDAKLEQSWGQKISDFQVVCVAGAGVWHPETLRFTHASAFYDEGGGVRVFDLKAGLEGVSFSLKQHGQTPKVLGFNDFEAQALAADGQPGHEAAMVVGDTVDDSGHVLVVGVGTGLGQAFLYFDGNRHILVRSEGGNSPVAVAHSWQSVILNWFHAHVHHPLIAEDILSGRGYIRLAHCLGELGLDEFRAFNSSLGFDLQIISEDLRYDFSRGGLSKSQECAVASMLSDAIIEGRAPGLRNAFGAFLGLELRSLALKFWGTRRIVLTGGVLAKCPELVIGNDAFKMALLSPSSLNLAGEEQEMGWRPTLSPHDREIAKISVALMSDPAAGAKGAFLCANGLPDLKFFDC